MEPAAETKTVLRYGPGDAEPAKRRKRVVRTLTLLAVATVGLILFILVMGDLRRHEGAFALAEAYIDQVSRRVGQQHALPLNLAFRVEEKPVGAIAIYRLLRQKTSFAEVDHELFRLLAKKAATAILASQELARAKRRWTFVQDALDLGKK